MGSTIIGCGKAVPTNEMTNVDLEALMDTSDEWIVERTGIHSRRIAITETATDLACAAAREALGIAADAPAMETSRWLAAMGTIDPDSIDLVICSTITPDMIVPSQAALIREAVGLPNAVCFDLNAACSGCVYGLVTADRLLAGSVVDMRHNRIHRALVVGSERLSRIVDWHDRSTAVLFGDGAGAVVLEWSDERPGIISSFLKNTTDDEGSLLVGKNNDLATFPFADRVTAPENRFGVDQHIVMNGQKVYRFATEAIVEAVGSALERAGIALDEVSCIVPHQANERIIRFAAKKMGVPFELFQVSIGDAANTSSASMLMALCDAYVRGRISRDDYVALVGFGGGLTAGALVFQSE